MKLLPLLALILLITISLVSATTTVQVPLYSMTVYEDDQNENDCNNYEEDVEWDEDYGDEEERAIMVLGYPNDYISYVPSNANVISATYYVYLTDEHDGGIMDTWVFYTGDDSQCDFCMDWEDAFDDCNIDSGDDQIDEVDTDDDTWEDWDITYHVNQARANGEYLAIWHKGDHSSAGDDMEQDLAGEDNNNYHPYVEIVYGDCNPSDVCCDSNGNFRASGYDCGTCKTCNSQGLCNVMPVDDSDCGVIDCDGLDTDCKDYFDLTSNRCEGLGDCKDPNTNDCNSFNNEADGTYCNNNQASCDSPSSCIGHRYLCSTGLCNDYVRDDTLCGIDKVCDTFDTYECYPLPMYWGGKIYRFEHEKYCTGQSTQGTCSGSVQQTTTYIQDYCEINEYCENHGDQNCSLNQAPIWNETFIPITLTQYSGINENVLDLNDYSFDYENMIDEYYLVSNSPNDINCSITYDNEVDVYVAGDYVGDGSCCFVINDYYVNSTQQCLIVNVTEPLLFIPSQNIDINTSVLINLTEYSSNAVTYSYNASQNNNLVSCTLNNEILTCYGNWYGQDEKCVSASDGNNTIESCFQITVIPIEDYVIIYDDIKVWAGTAGRINMTEFFQNKEYYTEDCTNVSCLLDFNIIAREPNNRKLDDLLIIYHNISNNPPNISAIPNHIMNEGKNLTININVTDEDNQTVSLSVVSGPGYTSNHGYHFNATYEDSGLHEVTIAAWDGWENSYESFNITVLNVNRPPDLLPISNNVVNEGDVLYVELNAIDPDNENNVTNDDNNLTYNLFGAGFVRYNTTTFTWNTTYEDSGVYTISANVSDGMFNDNESFIVTVNNSNRAPILNPVNNTNTQENSTITIELGGFDLDNLNNVTNDDNNLTYSIDNMFTQINSTTFTWTPNFEQSGEYTFNASIFDGELYGWQFFNVIVLNTNRMPSINMPNNQTGYENSTITITVNATDPDNTNNVTNDDNNLTYSINDSRFTQNNNLFTWDTSFEDSGIYTILLTVTDGEFNDTHILTLEILNVNQAPVLDFINNQRFNETDLVTIIVNATDPDNTNSVSNDDNNLTYSINDSRFTQNNNIFTWQTGYFDYGNYTLNVTVFDGTIEDSQIFLLEIENVNRLPVMQETYILPNPAYGNAVLEGHCSATDVDLENLKYYYEWYKNNNLFSSGTTSSYPQNTTVNVGNIQNNFITRGHFWKLKCKALDPYNESGLIESSEIEIQNFVPVISDVWIEPDPAYDADALYGYCNITDLDDPLLSISSRWFRVRNGQTMILGQTTLTSYPTGLFMNGPLSKSLSNPGDLFRFECTTSDPYGWIPWNESSNITILHDPTFFDINARISPEIPTPGDDLKGYCNSSSVSIGNITYSWTWFNNTQEHSSGNTTAMPNTEILVDTIPYNQTKLTDIWKLRCIAYGMGLNSGYDIDEVTISDPSLEITNVFIAPYYPNYYDNLSGYCQAGADYIDEVTFSWSWFKNGGLHSSGTAGTYPVNSQILVDQISYLETDFGDEWILSCSASGYGSTSEYLNSTPVNLEQDYPTEIISARIYPQFAYTNETLLGYCKGYDQNNQDLRYHYKWHKNGGVVSSGVTQYYPNNIEINVGNISSTQTNSGERWSLGCKAESSTNESSWLNSSITPIVRFLPPSIISTTIKPTNAYTNDDLRGYCKASDSYGLELRYEYEWYKDSVLYKTGTTIFYPQNVEINVDNISYYETSVGEGWVLGCRAVNQNLDYNTSNWLGAYKTIQMGIIKDDDNDIMPPAVDQTKRIAYWFGKVNQHNIGGVWYTDPDGTSGANINRLTYCQKWWPYTFEVKLYKESEFIPDWRDSGNKNSYSSYKPTYRCIYEDYKR